MSLKSGLSGFVRDSRHEGGHSHALSLSAPFLEAERRVHPFSPGSGRIWVRLSRVCALTEKRTRVSVKRFNERLCNSLVMPELRDEIQELSLLRVAIYTAKLLQVANSRIIAAAICKVYATVISRIYKKRRIYTKTSFRRAREFRNEDFTQTKEREGKRIPAVSVKLSTCEYGL